jgi:hypothetical protein
VTSRLSLVERRYSFGKEKEVAVYPSFVSMRKYELPAIILISGVSCALGGIIFEYYRPLVRKHARQVYIRKGIIQEIATGIDAAEEQI